MWVCMPTRKPCFFAAASSSATAASDFGSGATYRSTASKPPAAFKRDSFSSRDHSGWPSGRPIRPQRFTAMQSFGGSWLPSLAWSDWAKAPTGARKRSATRSRGQVERQVIRCPPEGGQGSTGGPPLSRADARKAGSAYNPRPMSPANDATRLRELTPAQWKSGIAAWLGWLFDGLDMHLYTLVAAPFVMQLLAAASPADAAVREKSSWIQAAFLVGWALGGGFFGRVGDRLGRSRALSLTI